MPAREKQKNFNFPIEWGVSEKGRPSAEGREKDRVPQGRGAEITDLSQGEIKEKMRGEQ